MDFIMKSKKRITTIVILSLLLLIFSACSNGEDASEKKDTLVSVSYTHLDVYKRQILYHIFSFFRKNDIIYYVI